MKPKFSMFENIKSGCFECILYDKTHELKRIYDGREMSRMFLRFDLDQSHAEDVKCYHDRVKAFAEAEMRREWNDSTLSA